MDDTAIVEIFNRSPEHARTETRFAWLETSKDPANTPSVAGFFKALSLVGLEEGVVTRALLRCSDVELCVVAGMAAAMYAPMREAGDSDAAQFWLHVGAMCAGHLASREE